MLRLLVEGLGPTEIGERLHLSVKTVSTHKTRILEKLNLGSTAELVRYALEHRADLGIFLHGGLDRPYRRG